MLRKPDFCFKTSVPLSGVLGMKKAGELFHRVCLLFVLKAVLWVHLSAKEKCFGVWVTLAGWSHWTATICLLWWQVWWSFLKVLTWWKSGYSRGRLRCPLWPDWRGVPSAGGVGIAITYLSCKNKKVNTMQFLSKHPPGQEKKKEIRWTWPVSVVWWFDLSQS